MKLLSLRPFQTHGSFRQNRSSDTTLPTCASLALLGPCFKTGHRVTTLRQSPWHRTWTRHLGTQHQGQCRTLHRRQVYGERTEHNSKTLSNLSEGPTSHKGRLHLPIMDERPSNTPERRLRPRHKAIRDPGSPKTTTRPTSLTPINRPQTLPD